MDINTRSTSQAMEMEEPASACEQALPLRQHAATPEALPEYLVRYYRWAYLWGVSVWFFDHQPIINAILFGNYRKIMNETLRMMDPSRAGKTLQVASVYGELIPTLAREIDPLHVIDVAPVQLNAVTRKLDKAGLTAHLSRMNAENLAFEADSFDTTLLFLLLHELPPQVRRNTLREAVRVLRPGGRLVIAEYGEVRQRHAIHRFAPLRWTLTTAEPFLHEFWNESLVDVVQESAAGAHKSVELEEQVDIFGGFYRVLQFRVR